MIGVVGIGAAGGNVADEAYQQGIPAIAINYSEKDLESLEYVQERKKLIGSEGVGKNRNEAIELMAKNWETATKFVKDNFSAPSIEIIMICFSTGGGSGSGIGPILIELLLAEMPDKTFVAVPIIPDTSEFMINQLNCVHASEELSRLPVCVLPIDNEQLKKTNTHIGKAKLYRRTNQTFVDMINSLYRFTEKQSKYGVLDQKDLRTILSTKGIALIALHKPSKLTEGQVNISPEGIAEGIQKSWETSIYVPTEKKQIQRAGLIFEGPDSWLEFIEPMNIFNTFENGMPMDLFEGYYQGDEVTIITILAGLSWYQKRLSEIEDIIRKQQDASQHSLLQDEEYQSTLSNIQTVPRSLPKAGVKAPVKKEQSKKKVSDIISRYKR